MSIGYDLLVYQRSIVPALASLHEPRIVEKPLETVSAPRPPNLLDSGANEAAAVVSGSFASRAPAHISEIPEEVSCN